MKKTALLLCVFGFIAPTQLSAHCQVPCGIYDDNNVLKSMHTDYETIEKAVKKIAELSKDTNANSHQLVRWINNKESHAQAMQEKVLNYFLAQRLKLAEATTNKESYLKKLETCHKVIVAAMKCKQSSDPKDVLTLHEVLHVFQNLFGEK